MTKNRILEIARTRGITAALQTARACKDQTLIAAVLSCVPTSGKCLVARRYGELTEHRPVVKIQRRADGKLIAVASEPVRPAQSAPKKSAVRFDLGKLTEVERENRRRALAAAA